MAPGTLLTGAGVLSPGMEQPPSPSPCTYLPVMPLREPSSRSPLPNQFSGMPAPQTLPGQSFLNLDPSLPIKGRENSLPFFVVVVGVCCGVFLIFKIYVLPLLLQIIIGICSECVLIRQC